MILAPVYLPLSTLLATAPVSADTVRLGKSGWFWNTAREEHCSLDASPRDGTGQGTGIQARHGACKHSHRLQQHMGAVGKVGAGAWVTIGWCEQIQKEGGRDGASFLPSHPFFCKCTGKCWGPCWNSDIYICNKNTLASLDELKPFHRQQTEQSHTWEKKGLEDDVNVVLC